MRVLMATSEYHRGGGFPRFAAQIATGLRDLGNSVTVAARVARTDSRDHGIEFEKFKTFRHPHLLAMAHEPWVLTKLFRSRLADFDAGIIVGIPCLAPVVLIGPGTHRAWYLTTTRARGNLVRGYVERLRPFHWVVMLWERAMLNGRHPALVVASTDAGVKEYIDLFGFPPERLVAIPCAVETDEFRFSEELRTQTRRELGLADDQLVMLHIGNRGRQKGLDLIVESLHELNLGVPWKFLFAGSGSMAKALASDTASLVAEGRVRLLGRVPDTRALYCAADLLVFPSRFDPWGLVVTEALACGLPVLCTASIGAAIAVRPGENGYVIDDASDSAELTERLRKVLPTVRSFDRSEVSASVAWLDRLEMARKLEASLEKLTPAQR